MCERAVFMEKGEVRFQGATSDLLERDDIARAVFLGGAPVDDAPVAPSKPRARRTGRARTQGVK
jgi:branched-chain amino acid transport system ATP-binding protein